MNENCSELNGQILIQKELNIQCKIKRILNGLRRERGNNDNNA
jgi:hypothetical protein